MDGEEDKLGFTGGVFKARTKMLATLCSALVFDVACQLAWKMICEEMGQGALQAGVCVCKAQLHEFNVAGFVLDNVCYNIFYAHWHADV